MPDRPGMPPRVLVQFRICHDHDARWHIETDHARNDRVGRIQIETTPVVGGCR